MSSHFYSRAIIVTMLMVVSLSYAARVKELTRVQGLQENPLVGYGLVVGLAGQGDSVRNKETMQSIANTLKNFDLNIEQQDIRSRNVASVMVTANMPAYVHEGDKLDVNVSSMGDARSLTGGTLMMAPLKGPNQQVYALAQGSVSVGGFKYDAFGNVLQKNHPTVGKIHHGAVAVKSLTPSINQKKIRLLLTEADFANAAAIEHAINQHFNEQAANAISADSIEVKRPRKYLHKSAAFIGEMQNIKVDVRQQLRVIVNERTGTIVAGGEVTIKPVVISQGNFRLSVSTDYQVSQPNFISKPTAAIRTEIVPETNIEVTEDHASLLTLSSGATVSDLVTGMAKVGASTRDVISILQAIKRADALDAELIVE